MLETSARLLKLLSLLQLHREWTGPELARRLSVSTRTVRNDVEKLRNLGYPVDATPGVSGGYRLGAGASLPPLLLDDDEAVAVVLGLRTSAGGAIAGIEESSVRALAKLEQVLPSRLRRRVQALQTKTHTVPAPAGGPTIDPDVLTVLATACRDHECLRFDYTDFSESVSRRSVEPHWLVNWGRRWYLLAFDTDRSDWRTFRVDRITPRTPTGPRFTPRELPEGADPAGYVSARVGSAAWRFWATIIVSAPADVVRGRLSFWPEVTPIDEHSCRLRIGSDNPHMLAVYLGLLDVDFVVTDPPELVEAFRALGNRYLNAVGGRE